MEWIKAKYDRLLLGFCGLIALVIGGWLLLSVLSWKKQFPNRPAPELREEFGTLDAGQKVSDALAALKAPALVKEKQHNSVRISLFSSAPILKLVGESEPIPILDPKAKLVRPPVDNVWLYNNGLEIRRTDILNEDTDGDKFSNLEEFNANPKTNPKDATNHPPIYAKIYYKECVQDPLTFKFNTYVGPTDLSFRRTEPADKAFNTRDLAVGKTFPEEKDGKEPRFQLDKVDGTEGQEAATLTDLKTKEKITVKIRESFARPILRAKLVCNHGKEEEKIVNVGEPVTFEADPDQVYDVIKITLEEVTLEFTPKGKDKKEQIVIKILPPP